MTFALDPISKAAFDAMRDTHENILLLGKAGTWKSTLISKYIREVQKEKKKNIAVVAPTGVAAMNIGGQTIHSFFKFSINVTIDDARQRAAWHKKQKIFQALETLIIDEISMVRADLLDCIDVFLRIARKDQQPFGGVQVIMVWDLLQLPPIVWAIEAELFASQYESSYFFHAHVMKNPVFGMHTYQLDKVYRQEDKVFIELLHRIRNNTATQDDIDIINSRVQRITTIAPGEIYISTTNARANDVNNTMLSRIKADEYYSIADIKGKIAPSSYPTDSELTLKVWAQIMFVVNNSDKWFMNGTLWTIKDIIEYDTWSDKWNEMEVIVQVHGQDRTITVQPYTREIRESIYNEKEKTITSEVVWSFEQLPIRLARACTIHKAQGKTFDSMIIDSGNGMFAAWQAYVALSRCTSLAWIKLVKPMRLNDILVDTIVSNYVQNIGDKSNQINIQTTKKITPKRDTNITRVLVFDTETTGVDKSARIVQIACALYCKNEDSTWVCESLHNYLINPLCPIPPQTTAVHGITDEMVADAPTIDIVWDTINPLFHSADVHIAHNHSFDERILAQEVRRLKLEKLTKRPVFCTMKQAVEVTRIPNDRGWYKRPKLAELYTHLWQKEIDWYHDALIDVKAAAACYFKLIWEDYDPFIS